MTEQDVKPWYRQFWPWFIICLPASAVVASLYTVSLAVRTTDSLVIASEDGMDVVTERHLAAEALARELGITARLDVDAASGAILIPPYDDPEIIAGQGTCGLEICRQAETLGVGLDAYIPPRKYA